jgi:hypothetical protein
MTTFVSRTQWGARPRESGTTSIIDNPSVTFHYVGGGWEFPWDHSTCDDKVRAIQADHMDNRGWSDIAYNYLTCPHDYVYEGRGYDRRSSANGSDSANYLSFAICALWGTASADDALPVGLKRAFHYARNLLRAKGGATSIVKGHRDWKSTTCPGDQIYTWIKAGIPLPSTEEPDMTTDASVAAIIKKATEPGGDIYKLVQTFTTSGNTFLTQSFDEIAQSVWDEPIPDVQTVESGDYKLARTHLTWAADRVEQELQPQIDALNTKMDEIKGMLETLIASA